MGNTALKQRFGFVGERFTSSEYYSAIENLSAKAEGTFQSFKPVLCYETKESHGDLDCACVSTSEDKTIQEQIQQLFGARYVQKNSNVYSFDYKEKHQVDMAVLPDEPSLKAYMFYCNYSPCGNIMGRMLKQLGLKLGINGLTYPVKLSDSEQLGDIAITNPFGDQHEKQILQLFDSTVPYGNFKTQQDIFNFLAESGLFNGDIFKFENLNHINRKRDKKRKDYHEWLESIKDKPNLFVGHPDKFTYIPFLENFFNVDITEQWKLLYGKHLVLKDLNRKFNGDIVRDITGKTGKELGMLIKTYKESFDKFSKTFETFLLTHNESEILAHFIYWYNTNYEKGIDL